MAPHCWAEIGTNPAMGWAAHPELDRNRSREVPGAHRCLWCCEPKPKVRQYEGREGGWAAAGGARALLMTGQRRLMSLRYNDPFAKHTTAVVY